MTGTNFGVIEIIVKLAGTDAGSFSTSKAGPLAYFSVVLGTPDGLKIRINDIKLICNRGNTFLSFPQIPVQRHCDRCFKNSSALSNYCGNCGAKFDRPYVRPDSSNHSDSDNARRPVVSPLNAETRDFFTRLLIAEYEKALAAR